MKVLHLTLKRKWFDLIASGQKKIEYRVAKQYWIRRLIGKPFTHIRFKNGYAKKAPAMTVEIKDKLLRTGDQLHEQGLEPQNGEPIDYNDDFILFKLGRVSDIEN